MVTISKALGKVAIIAAAWMVKPDYGKTFEERRIGNFMSGHTDAIGGFSAPTSVVDATNWIDDYATRLAGEEIGLAEAAGRVLTQDAVAAVDLPPFDQASVDGLAVLAGETASASAYNPLSLQAAATSGALPANAAILLSAGDPLPAATDAVVPLRHVEQSPSGSYEIIEAVAPGSGVERKASDFSRGAKLLGTGRRVSPCDIALLAAAGITRLQVVRRPRVSCLPLSRTITEGGSSTAAILQDANGPLLRELIRRDGGSVTTLRQTDRDRAAIRRAMAASDADVLIVVGGTGWGPVDASAAALTECGELAIRGIALNPGGTACLGRTGSGVPTFLLPGTPAACLWAYELFAGRAIRRRAGRDPALPFRQCEMTTIRKIVSVIGMTEICPVRCLSGNRMEPIASAAAAGLAAMAAADGFVIVAEGSEGVPEGARVTVHLREERCHMPIDREAERKP
jgi:molybdopterin molybdotransferase